MASSSGNGGTGAANSTEALLAVRDLCVSFRDESGWLETLKDVSLNARTSETNQRAANA